jgi:hypothetical protein
MTQSRSILLLAAIPFAGVCALEAQFETRAEFPGSALKWVNLAAPEFRRHHLDLDDYKVILIEKRDSMDVLLKSNDDVRGAKGSSGSHPDFDVEISKKDLTIMRSSYEK